MVQISWTAPRTWTTGEVVTATIMNQHVRDNLLDLDARTTVVGDTVLTSQATSSTTYTDLATPGPEVTVVIGSSGLALVAWMCGQANNTSGSASLMSFAVSGATTLAAADDRALTFTSPSNNALVRHGMTVRLQSLNAGSNTFTAKYRANANQATFDARRLLVTPLGS